MRVREGTTIYTNCTAKHGRYNQKMWLKCRDCGESEKETACDGKTNRLLPQIGILFGVLLIADAQGISPIRPEKGLLCEMTVLIEHFSNHGIDLL